ncbi:MAG: GIY-YIG nuclease family protein [Terriglobales bacterium]
MKVTRRFYIYILSSKLRRMYVGMTNFLFRRVMQHKLGEQDGFTKRYNINRLVYFETFLYVNNCLAREKQIKSWSRAKKVSLIGSLNPTWDDLAADWGTDFKPLLRKADSSRRSE